MFTVTVENFDTREMFIKNLYTEKQAKHFVYEFKNTNGIATIKDNETGTEKSVRYTHKNKTPNTPFIIWE